jgi:chromosome segregation ATPase
MFPFNIITTLQTSNTLPLLSQTTAHCLSVEDSLSSIVSRAGLILEQEEGESSPNLLEAEEQREQRRLHDLAKSLYLNLQRALEVNKKWKVDYNQIKEDKDRVIANLENKVQLLKEQLVAATKRDNTAEEKRWDLSKRSESHHKRLDQPVHQKSKQNSRKPRDDSELEKAPEMMKLQHEVEYLRRELHDAKRKLNQINSGVSHAFMRILIARNMVHFLDTRSYVRSPGR